MTRGHRGHHPWWARSAALHHRAAWGGDTRALGSPLSLLRQAPAPSGLRLSTCKVGAASLLWGGFRDGITGWHAGASSIRQALQRPGPGCRVGGSLASPGSWRAAARVTPTDVLRKEEVPSQAIHVAAKDSRTDVRRRSPEPAHLAASWVLRTGRTPSTHGHQAARCRGALCHEPHFNLKMTLKLKN